MVKSELIHSVHIPVMGTAFTVDTPIRVARFGISSVMSIGDDELCEFMREQYSESFKIDFVPIKKREENYRVRRITAYLNLVDAIVKQQVEALRKEPFEPGTEITKYFEMLPNESPLKQDYQLMMACQDPEEKVRLQAPLRTRIRAGSLDVNIMTKLDRNNYDRNGELLPEPFSDALTALRGFAESTLSSGVVFSAGFNRRLYAYLEEFSDFYPDENGHFKKKIILKVSDFRSSLTQGKFLAKKGIWVSEHRVESGLNCGGHVFPSEGQLLGPIMEEFKQKKDELLAQLLPACNEALAQRGKPVFNAMPYTRLTVQGGIGTFNEQLFLMEEYPIDGTGWGTPFLLVPEATIVSQSILDLLIKATPEDTYTSSISPLGVRFNTVRGTESEQLKLKRVEEGHPGSPCPKGHLVSNTEFTETPICTASVLYQRKKIEQLKSMGLAAEAFKKAFQKVIDKACLCEDLAASALLLFKKENKRALAPAVCPGPNIAYFSKVATLAEMMGHIYGRINILNELKRPNMFVNEVKLYIDHLAMEIADALPKPTPKQIAYFIEYKHNLVTGIEYYKQLVPKMIRESQKYQDAMKQDLQTLRAELEALMAAYPFIFAESQLQTA